MELFLFSSSASELYILHALLSVYIGDEKFLKAVLRLKDSKFAAFFTSVVWLLLTKFSISPASTDVGRLDQRLRLIDSYLDERVRVAHDL